MQSLQAGKYFAITLWLRANILNCVLFFTARFAESLELIHYHLIKLLFYLAGPLSLWPPGRWFLPTVKNCPPESVSEEHKEGASHQDAEELKEFSHIDFFACPITVWHPNPEFSNFTGRKPNQLPPFPSSYPQPICASRPEVSALAKHFHLPSRRRCCRLQNAALFSGLLNTKK